LGETDNNAATVKMSVSIRGKIRDITKEVDALSNMQKKEQGKLEDKKAKVCQRAPCRNPQSFRAKILTQKKKKRYRADKKLWNCVTNI
jgi:hypothetical protein